MRDCPYLSIVIPVYNEAENVGLLYQEVKKVLSSIQRTYEIIIIDDGSKDETRKILKEIEAADETLRVLSLRKNFGKASALSCGFSKALGEIIVTMDGDLQDDPEEIPRFLECIKEYDVVSGWKQNRKDPLSKIIPSRIFNYITSVITRVEIHDFNCGYKAYRREVVKTLNIYGEMHRYIPALANWKGYSVGELKDRHRPRIHGKSKYGVKRLFKGTMDLLTVKFLISYCQKPLHLFGSIGLVSVLAGFGACSYLLYSWLNGARIGDRPLLTLGVLMITLGVQFVAIGLIGELIVHSRENMVWVLKED